MGLPTCSVLRALVDMIWYRLALPGDFRPYCSVLRARLGDTFCMWLPFFPVFVVTFDRAAYTSMAHEETNGSVHAVWPMIRLLEITGKPFAALQTGPEWFARRRAVLPLISQRARVQQRRQVLFDHACAFQFDSSLVLARSDCRVLVGELTLFYCLDRLPANARDLISVSLEAFEHTTRLFYMPQNTQATDFQRLVELEHRADAIALDILRASPSAPVGHLPVDDAYSMMRTAGATVGDLLFFCLYLLARFPHVQERFRSGAEDHEAYVRAFFKEQHRFMPIGNGSVRYTSSDRELAGYLVPANSIVVLINDETYPMPDLFLPERWLTTPNGGLAIVDGYVDGAFALPARTVGDIPFAGVPLNDPFGTGARRCVGSNFTPFLVELCLDSVLSRFELTCDPHAPPLLAQGLTNSLLRPPDVKLVRFKNPELNPGVCACRV